ncbi:MAG: MinD/ParA family protein [Desulfotignum sp.]|nr:MinD/ParA family protein [Desulfobacteraceae bacterium]
MAHVITITSGKGGVGKTSISLNLSLSLASAGHRVCLFDADLGLANVNILTGIFPEHGLDTVISGEKQLGDIMIRNFQGIDIIPGSSGVEKMADLTAAESRHLIQAFLQMGNYDYFIFDTSAGISAQVMAFCRASHQIILVITPEPTSLTDAYSLLKVLSRKTTGSLPPVRVVVNQVKTAVSARSAYAKLKETVKKFLSLKISALGIVARDNNVSISVVSQVPFTILFPGSAASRCVRSLAMKLKDGAAQDLPMEIFWDQCLALMGSGRSREPVKVPRTDQVEQRLSAIESRMATLLEQVTSIKQILLDDRKDKTSAGTKPDVPGRVHKPQLNQQLNQQWDRQRTRHLDRKPERQTDRRRNPEQDPKPQQGQDLPNAPKLSLDFESWMDGQSF